MTDDRIAEVVDVSKPGATLQVHEVRLTEKGKASLDVHQPSTEEKVMADDKEDFCKFVFFVSFWPAALLTIVYVFGST